MSRARERHDVAVDDGELDAGVTALGSAHARVAAWLLASTTHRGASSPVKAPRCDPVSRSIRTLPDHLAR